jgi:hypothetical protein
MTGDIERCIACGGIVLDDDEVYDDAGGGIIHAKCCGPERECYVDLETGEPLKDGAPIPKPWKYKSGE